MQRIVILGCSGAGKSTLARELAARTGLPIVHLDPLYWRAGWTAPETEPFRARVAAALAGDRWIVDGNFLTLAGDLTLPRADTILWLEPPRWLCLVRAIWRGWTGRPRPDLPEGCRDSFDRQGFDDIWTYGRVSRPAIAAHLKRLAPDVPVIRLDGDRATAAWLAGTQA